MRLHTEGPRLRDPSALPNLKLFACVFAESKHPAEKQRRNSFVWLEGHCSVCGRFSDNIRETSHSSTPLNTTPMSSGAAQSHNRCARLVCSSGPCSCPSLLSTGMRYNKALIQMFNRLPSPTIAAVLKHCWVFLCHSLCVSPTP